MKNQAIKICNATIHPGEKATLALPLPEQYSCCPMYMPIKVINGKRKGPCLLIFSTLKGHELNGLEIVNQVFDLFSGEELQGTLITLPVLNIFGLAHYPKMSPSGGSLENSFPGNENGTFSERIAYIFTKEILKKATLCIELQTGSLNHEILPQTYCNFDIGNSRRLAQAFQAPVIIEVTKESSKIRKVTESLNIPFLVYEAGEAMRFDQSAIQIGLEGIKNIMYMSKMLDGTIERKVTPVYSKDDGWLTAHSSGILHSTVSLGERVKKGEKIGRLSDPFSNDNATIVNSPIDGIIVGVNRTPLIQEGVSIFKIASFLDNIKVEAILEEWEESQPELND